MQCVQCVRCVRCVLAANSKVTIVVRQHEKGAGDLHEMILWMLKPYERSNERALIPPQPSAHQIEVALKIFFSYAIELVGAWTAGDAAGIADCRPFTTDLTRGWALPDALPCSAAVRFY